MKHFGLPEPLNIDDAQLDLQAFDSATEQGKFCIPLREVKYFRYIKYVIWFHCFLFNRHFS